MFTDQERADKIEASKRRVKSVMLHLLNRTGKVAGPTTNIDYDLDTRWDTVSATSIRRYRGKDYRVTVEEVIDE